MLTTLSQLYHWGAAGHETEYKYPQLIPSWSRMSRPALVGHDCRGGNMGGRPHVYFTPVPQQRYRQWLCLSHGNPAATLAVAVPLSRGDTGAPCSGNWKAFVVTAINVSGATNTQRRSVSQSRDDHPKVILLL